MIETHAKQVSGSWDQGYVLDVHTISSTMIGYNEFGYPEFDTVRSQLGELVYRLKYKGDKTVIPPVVEATVAFVKNWGVRPDVIVPMPPSKAQRNFQPVVEVAGQLAESLGVPLNTTSLVKTSPTQQMKDIGDFTARIAALEGVLRCDTALEGKAVLLFDDLFQSGASMNVSARVLKHQGFVRSVYALALTRTRS
jgi:competence protein ComFC